ncbi:DeoR/GlpR family DNA-binding transcription regulator [Garciella nitratireducens]|uniref:DeoR/GlpR family DNA-binding transcription regulator n=1 Tax=Garciella nitratireducens TaxID=218205 RepID=UPI000DEA706F|nr:DeoR/GlpR family DNA-binding transcription regulator [Garciella nitratireducens]RBP42289.1 DeoR family transcriptional regulator [Garciella nitratireducens]
MLSSERLEKILEYVNKKGSAEVRVLSEYFDVSEITIRRDLNKLEEEGLILRTYGGAKRKKPLAHEVVYDEKKFKNHGSKVKIAKEALALIENKMTILLDAGTSTFELADQILHSNLQDLTVVTNDINIAHHLYNVNHVQVVMLGGSIIKHVGNTQGFLTRQALRCIYCDIAFIGTSAMSEDLKLFTPSEEKIELKKLMIQNSEQSVLLVDQSKLGEAGLYCINDVKDFDYIVTDILFTEEQFAFIKKYHTQVIYVKGGEVDE